MLTKLLVNQINYIMKTIEVSLDSKGKLKLSSNNGSIDSPKNGKVKWKVIDDSITGILVTLSKKQGQIDIWSSPPVPYPDNDPKSHPPKVSLNWRGTTGDKTGAEDYNISYSTSLGGGGSIDPRITVNL